MASIGSVNFEEDLIWIPNNEDVDVLGQDTRTSNGSIVSIRLPQVQEFRTYRFGRITAADWRILKYMAESGASYPFNPKTGGPTHNVRFAQQYPLRIFNYDERNDTVAGGEIRLIFPTDK